MTPSSPLSDNRAAYERDGYVVVKGLYTARECSEWKERVVATLGAQGRLNEPSGVNVWMCDSLDPCTLARIQDVRAVDVLTRLVGPDIEFLSIKPVFKNAATTFGSPWHQDWDYWQGSHKISVWIALDQARVENGCVRAIPGSHRTPKQVRRVPDKKGFNLRLDESDLAGLPVADLEMEPGDALFLHDMLVHSSHPNQSGKDRWSMIPTYRNAAIPDDSTVWQKTLLVSGKTVNSAART